MTVDEVCEMLRIVLPSPKARRVRLSQLIYAKGLPAWQSRPMLFLRRDVQNWILSRAKT